ncbi:MULTISPECIES: cytochrome c [Oscillatoriales]|uniref:c-type cytochrome n=1 Tax=Oscillatoriophycideae TaxID=1301283 RepID=UPI001F54DEDA|nr:MULTISPECIES: cytochrome c [Oscillatoriales]
MYFLIVLGNHVEKQVTKLEAAIGQLTLMALAVVLAVLVFMVAYHQWQISDPYVKNVLSLKGDGIRGHAIFQMNCAGCHGLQADGRVGPSLQGVSKHKSPVGLIHQVTSGDTPPMPQFQPSPQEMADLLSYLKQL